MLCLVIKFTFLSTVYMLGSCLRNCDWYIEFPFQGLIKYYCIVLHCIVLITSRDSVRKTPLLKKTVDHGPNETWAYVDSNPALSASVPDDRLQHHVKLASPARNDSDYTNTQTGATD